MTTATSAAAAPAAPAATATASRKKPLIGIGVLLAAAAAWFFLMGPGAGAKEESAKEPVPGEVLPLEPITMNLADGRLLKVGLALQLPEGEGHGELSGSLALDEAIAFLGEHTYAQLSAPEGRAKAKVELSTRVAARYHDEVMEVYFTEFVMQ